MDVDKCRQMQQPLEKKNDEKIPKRLVISSDHNFLFISWGAKAMETFK